MHEKSSVRAFSFIFSHSHSDFNSVQEETVTTADIIVVAVELPKINEESHHFHCFLLKVSKAVVCVFVSAFLIQPNRGKKGRKEGNNT